MSYELAQTEKTYWFDYKNKEYVVKETWVENPDVHGITIYDDGKEIDDDEIMKTFIKESEKGGD